MLTGHDAALALGDVFALQGRRFNARRVDDALRRGRRVFAHAHARMSARPVLRPRAARPRGLRRRLRAAAGRAAPGRPPGLPETGEGL